MGGLLRVLLLLQLFHHRINFLLWFLHFESQLVFGLISSNCVCSFKVFQKLPCGLL